MKDLRETLEKLRADAEDCLLISRLATDKVKRETFKNLKDAGTYITKLPKVEHSTAEWQAAMEALILVATLGGPTMFARIGVMRALNRHVERVFDPSRKDHHWGRRKLARDRWRRRGRWMAYCLEDVEKLGCFHRHANDHGQ
jgi:hypothetical protein